MKEEINLLPHAQQTLRQRRLYLYRLGQLLRRADIALVVLAGLMLTAYIGMESVQSSLRTTKIEKTQEDADLIAEVAEINAMLAYVQEYRLAARPWTPVVTQAMTSMPEGMQLTSVEANDAAGQLTLKGQFTDREAVVEFQRRLAQLPEITHVEAPLSNFATGGASNFSFTLTRSVGP